MSQNRRPTHQLEHIAFITDNPTNNDQTRPLCDIFGIYQFTDIAQGNHYWSLIDETRLKPLKVRLCGNHNEYPEPKRGDVVRIHRLTFDKNTNVPLVMSAKNVLIWRSFRKTPEKVHTSEHPTINDQDLKRQVELEACYIGILTKLGQLQNLAGEPSARFHDVAGLIISIDEDAFGNKLVPITDGTDKILLRVFKKIHHHEISDHYDIVCSSKPGDYIVATNAKFSLKAGETKLDLSANTQYGRSVQKVEKESLLGRQLTERLKLVETAAESNITSSSNNCSTVPIEPSGITNGSNAINEENDPNSNSSPRRNATTTSTSRGTLSQPISLDDSSQQSQRSQEPQLRRSARLQTRSNSNQSTSSNSINTSTPPKRQSLTPPQNLAKKAPPLSLIDAPITKVFQLQKKPAGKYDYHNFVGQVRGVPNPALAYGNWVFQFYDGTKPQFAAFHEKYVDKAEENCSIIFVYSKQSEHDTDVHVQMVKSLQEGDLVYLKNVKVSWVDNKVRFEINASARFDKGIKMIDKDSEYGRQLLDQFATPSTWPEECDEDVSQESINNTSFLFKPPT